MLIVEKDLFSLYTPDVHKGLWPRDTRPQGDLSPNRNGFRDVMKISYLLSSYVSHLKAGTEYIKALRLLGADLVADPGTADVVVIHDEPPSYPLYFQRFPALKEKYVIAYAVWETDMLPQAYLKGLRLVNERWTCSEYTRMVLSKYFDNVYKVPHVVPAYRVSQPDVEYMKDLLNYDPEAYYFYTIADAVNPRKNLFAGLESFLKVQSMTRRKVFFVVKQYRKAVPYISSLPHVISIAQDLSEARIHALHALCDCYVSSHCAEAWGLSISDAMSFGNLAVATGYSGNMEYMREDNSFPVTYALAHIREQDLRFQPGLLDTGMRWAYVDVNDLARKMMRCLGPADHSEIRKNARQTAVRFSHRNIAELMEIRLKAIGEALQRPFRVKPRFHEISDTLLYP